MHQTKHEGALPGLVHVTGALCESHPSSCLPCDQEGRGEPSNDFGTGSPN
jgi:hypothetical protein